jgi:outer membrane receptor protein involved in Fe transport
MQTGAVPFYDPELTPEFTSELEVGTEMRLFKGRIGFELTYYDKRTTNLIYGVSVACNFWLHNELHQYRWYQKQGY